MDTYKNISAGLAARMALRKHGFHFTHSLGQNFILDDELVKRIVQAAQIKSGEEVLEIGPGAGVMTCHLADLGAHVTAVELDRALEPVLCDVLGTRENVRLVFGDALKLDLGELMNHRPYRVIANLPYYITSDLIQRLVTHAHKPTKLTIMVQKEAAERIMAKPNSKEWCALAATVQYFSAPRVLMDLPPEAFTPRPHVNSALIELAVYEQKPVQAQDETTLMKLISSCFQMRRKTLLNNLTASFSIPREKALSHLEAAGLDTKIRGEALTLRELVTLSDIMSSGT